MERTRGGFAGKLLAFATAIALVATMAVGTTTAQALQDGGQTAPGSITVHKYKTQTASNIPGTGADSQSVPYGAEPLSGVQFTLYQLDTAKVEGAVQGVDAVKAAPATADVSTFLTAYQDATASPIVKTTDQNGEAVWGSLPFAYYLLVETSAGTDTVEAAVPSIVTVPYAQQATGGSTTFVKDVHVYPKNVSNELVEKSVTNQPDVVKPGDTLNYTITFSVPTAGKVYTSDTQYMTGSVIDKLPVNGAGQPTITIAEGSYSVYALTEGGTESQLTSPITFLDESASKAQTTWTLTSGIAQEVEGLNTATPADPVAKIQIRVAATVNDNAFSAGVGADGQPSISNTAKVTVHDIDGTAVIDGSESTTDPITTPGFEFTKVDSAGAAITASSASFKLAATYDDATSGAFLRSNGVDLVAATSTTNGKAVFSGLNGTLTVGSSGTAYTAVSDAVAAAQANVGVDQAVEVWLVETQAPNGYRILQAPQKVTLHIQKATASAMVTTTVANGPLSIVNAHNGEEGGGNFTLPNTGGTGALIFIAVGLVLVGVAVTYFVRSRKRVKNDRR